MSFRQRLLRLPQSVVFRARGMFRTAMSRAGASMRHRIYGADFVTELLTGGVPGGSLPRASRLASETEDIVAYADTVQCRALARYLKGLADQPVIVDIGAYRGGYVLFAAKIIQEKGPAVIAVEPQPFNFQILKKNIALNGLEKTIIPMHAAIGNDEGFVELSGSGTQTRVVKGQPFERKPAGSVEIIRYAELLRRCEVKSVDLCVIDTEGHEIEILESIEESGVWPSVMLVEFHPFAWTNGRKDLERVQYLLKRNKLICVDAFWRLANDFELSDYYIGPCLIRSNPSESGASCQ